MNDIMRYATYYMLRCFYMSFLYVWTIYFFLLYSHKDNDRLQTVESGEKHHMYDMWCTYICRWMYVAPLETYSTQYTPSMASQSAACKILVLTSMKIPRELIHWRYMEIDVESFYSGHIYMAYGEFVERMNWKWFVSLNDVIILLLSTRRSPYAPIFVGCATRYPAP